MEQTTDTAPYSILTPYKLPPGSTKKVNAGDGFIMDSCEKLIGHKAAHYFSSRSPFTSENIDAINATRALLVAGANSLRDDFAPAPEFTRATLERITVPVILTGLGHYGVAEATQGMTASSAALLEAILERFPFMSVRCDRSRDYAARALPAHADRILMTSCPVAYPLDGIDKQFAAKESYDTLIVTITDRVHLEQQMPLVQHLPAFFPARRKVLALHQDYGNRPLHDAAARLGYEVFTGERYEDFIALYKNADLHAGNRVHGHLKALSLGIRSFLFPFDLRQAYFAESLDFPLIQSLPAPEFTHYDFNRFVARRNRAAQAMQTHIGAIKKVLAA